MIKQVFSVFLLAATLTAAGGQLPESISARSLHRAAARPVAPEQEADLLLINDLTRLRYETDGTYTYTVDRAVKILTEKGRREKSVVRTGYDAAYGTNRFVRAELIKPDGRTVPIDLKRQVSEAIAQGQMNANIYDPNHKTVRLTVPDLEIGDVLHYRIAGERSKAVVPGTWSDWFTLEETYPIESMHIEVDAPAELPLQRIELKAEIPGTVQFREQTTEGRILYSWQVNDVPRMHKEPGMPAQHTVVQRLLLSTIPDWETLSEWYWELSKPRLDAVTPAMREKTDALIAGTDDRRRQIEAVFRFVSQQIRYMGITVEDEAPGYEPHDVNLTFENRYGVCRDKAALLTAMLRIAGFDARPVLIYVGPRKDPEVPQPWFNHAITAVREEDGRWLLMDATNENTRDLLPAYLCNRSYLVATPDGEPLRTSPVIPPEDNMLTIDIDAALDTEQTIRGTALLQFNGINDTAYRGRLARLKPDEREPYFEERLRQALPGARLLELQIRPADVRNTAVPLSAELRFEAPDALAAQADEALLQPPTLVNAFGLFGRLLGDGIGLEKRRYPLQTDVTCGIRETVRLDLRPAGLQPVALPEYEPVDTDNLLIRRSAALTNQLLVSRADIRLRTVEFSPEAYQQLKQSLQTSERNVRRRILLEPAAIPPESDLAVLSETATYTLYDPHNWKEERILKKKVLTYAGKREAADLQIQYNPACERVTLKSARVTSPDGRVQTIDPATEINIMDADWNSDAPRYPGGKILVASLPGVEVGSVIELHILRMHFNRPFFSAMESFAGRDPVLSKQVTVIIPHKLDLQTGNTAPGQIRRRTAHRNERAVHEWTSAPQRKPIKTESHLPPEWVVQPVLFLSTGDAEDYADRVRKVLRAAADDTRALRETARRIIDGKRTRLEKITALRDFTDRAVRQAGPGFSDLPLSAVTPADRVLAEGYGNTADRAVLLSALLEAAGLDPRFVLSSDLPRIPEWSAPAIETLQHDRLDTLLVAVKDDDKQVVYLGDTGQYARPGALAHHARPALDLARGEMVVPEAAVSDTVDSHIIMQLEESGDVSLLKRIAFAGTEFEAFHKKFAQFTPEERRREHQTLLSGLSQLAEPLTPLKTSLDGPGLLQFDARLPGYAVRNGNQMYFTLPGGSLGRLLDLRTSKRENPFYIEKPIVQSALWEVDLPDHWTVELLPEPFISELPAGAGTVEVKTARLPNRIAVLQQIRLNPAVIPPEEYEALLDIRRKLTAPRASTVLLRKDKEGPIGVSP